MISTLEMTILIIDKKKCLLTLLVLFLFSFALPANAQMSQSISVSPTIFDMSAEPGRVWNSSIRIINSNPYELRVYIDVTNFAPEGEVGKGKFIPVVPNETKGQTLAEWFNFETKEIIIPPEQTKELSFSITAPESAVPGGHFAAIMVGTKPPESNGEKPMIQTSQIVTSLVFMRITGDINESGRIRSFRTTDWMLDKPQANFELRFENNGNVHIQPQGEIQIKNMWGQIRGVIPVNREMLYGTVLPDSVRKYSFEWTGEWSLADIGRYTAIATLGYGYEARQFDHSETAFWVVPWKIVLIFLLIIFGFLSFMTWAIKAYIRRMLSLAGMNSDLSVHTNAKRVSVSSPIQEGILDLRKRMNDSESFQQKIFNFGGFVKHYKLFFFAIVVIIIFVLLATWYIHNASMSERAYEVTIKQSDGDVSVSSEQLKYDNLINEMHSNDTTATTTVEAQAITLNVINRSGVSGLAAKLRLNLEAAGYTVNTLSTDLGSEEENTVIVYDPAYTDEALALSNLVEGALLSAFVDPINGKASITIYVGRDIENAL